MGMSKSREHLIRTYNHTPDDPGREEPHRAKRGVRQSEFPVSAHGMNQESDHNKHNRSPKGAPKH